VLKKRKKSYKRVNQFLKLKNPRLTSRYWKINGWISMKKMKLDLSILNICIYNINLITIPV
jgi:hypothetical protein